MWRKKKFIIGLLVAVLVMIGSLGGVALAQKGDDEVQSKSLTARVAEILGIDQQSLEDAFSQARAEMREEALDKHLQNLVDEGIITEEEASEYKGWLDLKPDMSEYKNKMKEWFESKPDIPDMSRFKMFGKFRGMGEIRIFGGLCLPTE